MKPATLVILVLAGIATGILVALGLARASLAAFMKLAETKKPSATHGAPIALRDNPVIQGRVAKATGRLQSARAYLTVIARDPEGVRRALEATPG